MRSLNSIVPTLGPQRQREAWLRAGWSGEVCSIPSRAKVRGKGCGSLKVCWTEVRLLGILLQVGCEEHIGQEKTQAGKRLETRKHPKLSAWRPVARASCREVSWPDPLWQKVGLRLKGAPTRKVGHPELQAGC